MKRKTLILTTAVFALLIYACSPSYYGKTYPPTTNVDIFLNSNDIKKPYTTMGNAEVEVTMKSTEATQQQLIKLAQQKGADGVILNVTEEVDYTNQTTSGTVTKGRDKNNIHSSTTTSDSKTKKIRGIFIKYNTN